MPWRQADARTQRRQFVLDARERSVTFTDLSALYGISRVTGYKWRHRADPSGLDLLLELSRRPVSRHHVARLMRTAGLAARVLRVYRANPHLHHFYNQHPNRHYNHRRRLSPELPFTDEARAA